MNLDTIEFEDIESSNIQGIFHNIEKDYLMVKFNPKSIYIYDGVPGPVVKEFREAKSKGGFFYRNIRDQYPTERVKV